MIVSPKRGQPPLRYVLAVIPVAFALLLVVLPQHRRSLAAQLHDAVRQNDPREVARLLHRGAPADTADEGDTPLSVALANTMSDVNATQTKEATGRREQIVASLLKAGADPNGSSQGMSHLTQAIILPSVPVVKDLLAHGAGPNSLFQGRPLLMYAVAQDAQLYSQGRQERPLLTETLHSAGAEARIRCPFTRESSAHSVSDEELPLIVAVRYCYPGAIHKEDPPLVEALLSYGVNVDGRDHDGRTALSYAAIEGAPQDVQVLLAHGADPSQVDRDGYTPLQRAQASYVDALAQTKASRAKKHPLVSRRNYPINASTSTTGSDDMREIKTRYDAVKSQLTSPRPAARP